MKLIHASPVQQERVHSLFNNKLLIRINWPLIRLGFSQALLWVKFRRSHGILDEICVTNVPYIETQQNHDYYLVSFMWFRLFCLELYVTLQVLFWTLHELHDFLSVFYLFVTSLFILCDLLPNPFLMALVDKLGTFGLQLSFIQRLLAISQALDVVEILLLNDLEFFDYFGVF